MWGVIKVFNFVYFESVQEYSDYNLEFHKVKE